MTASPQHPTPGGTPISIPVHEEQIAVGTRVVDTGRGVRIHKSVEEIPYQIDETLRSETLDIQRVPVDRIVALDQAPAPRQEGATLVVPVIEEIVVLERRLRIKEEIRITRIQHEERVQDTVFLKSEEVNIERFNDASKPN